MCITSCATTWAHQSLPVNTICSRAGLVCRHCTDFMVVYVKKQSLIASLMSSATAADLDTCLDILNEAPDVPAQKNGRRRKSGVFYASAGSDDNNNLYRSCCFRLDRKFVTFVVQTMIGLCILSFCAIQLASIDDCNRSTPYWGLVGTITGFFFRKMSIKSSTS